MLLRVFEVASFYEEALRLLEGFGVKERLNVVWKGLFSGCFGERNVLCAFLTLHICDVVWSRLTALHLLRSIHCLWRVF